MKILIALLAAVLAVALTAHAQTTDTKSPASQQPPQADQQMQMGCKMMGGGGMGGGMMGGHGGMGGGKMCCMMGQGMMSHDILDVVTGMLKVQQKIVEGVTPAEKDALLRENARLQGMVEQMQKTAHSMPMMHKMPMDHSSPQPETKQGAPGAGKEAPKPQMQHQH